MTVVFVVLAVVIVFAIAAAFVGSEAFRLGHEAPAAIFDLDEAVAEVGDALPDDVQARVTYDEVRQLILATLDHLRSKGLGALPGEDLPAPSPDRDVVVADDDAVAVALAAVESAGLEVADEDAFVVISALLGHLSRIGALGPRA
ncbi:MAG: hypothetical protein M3Z03_06370 [Actinomycetota bacterium]|nr:hypothetical protein [Actinomycetota bacterium]